MDRYDIDTFLGQTSDSTVYSVTNSNKDNTMVVKRIEDTSSAEREYFILNYIRPFCGDSLLRGKFMFCDTQYSYIVTEFIDTGVELQKFIQNNPKLNDRQRLTIIKNCIEATMLMHNNGVIHRDIKPKNVIVRDDLTVVFIDFGLACIEDCESPYSVKREHVGSSYYVDPCIPMNNMDNCDPELVKSSDRWSLGVMIYFIAFGKIPWTSKGYGELLMEINTVFRNSHKTDWDEFDKLIDKEVEKGCMEDIKICRRKAKMHYVAIYERLQKDDYVMVDHPIYGELIEGLLRRDPIGRISLDEVLYKVQKKLI